MVFQNKIEIGHVFLGDYDNRKKEHVLYNIDKLPGITLLLRSSEENYHLINLSIRTKEEQGILHLDCYADALHNATCYQQGKWILRMGAKHGLQGVYKSHPELLEVFCSNTLLPQSYPHLRVLQSIYGGSRFMAVEKIRYLIAGNSMNQIHYHTTTDELKEDLK